MRLKFPHQHAPPNFFFFILPSFKRKTKFISTQTTPSNTQNTYSKKGRMQLVPGSTKKKKKITQREGKKRKTNLKGLLNVLCIALYISVSPTLSLSFWSASSPRLPHYKPKTSKKKQPNLILLIIFCGRSSALVLGILVFRAPVLIFLPHHQTLFFFCPAATFKKKTIYPNSVNMMMVMKRAISKKNIYQKTTLAY